MRLAIIGTGYVGLVTGTCFAETGNTVTCIDIDAAKVELLRAGRSPIYEPGLDVLLERNIREGRLSFTTSLREGIEGAAMIFLALPTPPGADGSADLAYVLGAVTDLAPLLKEYTVVINKSTVPVGTAEKVRDVLLGAGADPDLFDVASNPEFLREGVAVEDFLKPDRVVIGTDSERAQKLLEELYAPYVRQGNPVHFMDPRPAEMTKYAANAYLALRISYMNEMANLCERLGADVDAVRTGMGSDARIGKRFLFPGIGYGGSCFPKDVQALAQMAREVDYEYQLVESTLRVNARQKSVLGHKIKEVFGNDLSGRTIAVWGLSFKPETDDIREAPSLYLIDELLAAGATVQAFDPEATENVRRVLGDRISYATESYRALEGADALAVVTEWSAFRNPDFERMEGALKHPFIFDGRNVWTLEKMESLPFYYESIGRRTIHADVRHSLRLPLHPEAIVHSRGL